MYKFHVIALGQIDHTCQLKNNFNDQISFSHCLEHYLFCFWPIILYRLKALNTPTIQARGVQMESHSVSGKRGFICAMGLFFVVVAGEKSYTIFYFRQAVYGALFLHAICLKFVLWTCLCLHVHDVHVDYCLQGCKPWFLGFSLQVELFEMNWHWEVIKF